MNVGKIRTFYDYDETRRRFMIENKKIKVEYT